MLKALATLLPLMLPAPLAAAPAAEPWARWKQHATEATLRVDQAAWAAFLGRYTVPGRDGITRVAYGRVTPGDRSLLRAAIGRLAGIPVTQLDRREQMAFWINLYNMLTVDTVLEHYPVASIRDIDISPGLFSDGPWGQKLIEVEGEPVSLDDIEHRILRPLWRDPRVHYALNCASLGCPELKTEPFAAARLDEELDTAARAFIRHPRGLQVAAGRVEVSSLYVWYQTDFGGDEAAVLRHLMAYARPATAMQLHGVDRVHGHSYDWRLNDAP